MNMIKEWGEFDRKNAFQKFSRKIDEVILEML